MMLDKSLSTPADTLANGGLKYQLLRTSMTVQQVLLGASVSSQHQWLQLTDSNNVPHHCGPSTEPNAHVSSLT
eukprot:11639443-Alexandrium_andersonii.AAC.1